MDSGADSCVAGKYAHILELIEELSVSTQGYYDNIPIQHNLPIANVLYAYDHPISGETHLLELDR